MLLSIYNGSHLAKVKGRALPLKNVIYTLYFVP